MFQKQKYLQIKDRLRSHAEEEVEDGEIGLKTVTVLKYLPVRFRLEVGIGLGMLGVYHLPKVGEGS